MKKEKIMKKQLLFLFILAVTVGMIYSQSITVTSPSGGTWYKGNTYNITWTATGCSSTSYKINIFRGSIAEANFVEQLTKTGTPSKSWTVPMGYSNGTYYIRVKTDPSQTGCVGDSAAFTIANEPTGAEPGSIVVTSPTGSTKWLRGSTQTITWTKSGDLDSNVKINIFKNSISETNFVAQLNGPNSGSKSWAIPATYEPGTYYVRVKESSGDVFGDSPGFQITNFLTFQPVLVGVVFKPHSITINEPSRSELAKNSRIRILWKPKNLTNNVKISLIKNGEVFGIIEEGLAPGRISTEWTVGQTLIKTALPDSGFKIRIEETGINNVFAESREFSIVDEKKVDLSCYVSGHSSRDSGRVVRLTVKVRINNFGGPALARVPVRVNVRTVGDDPESGETKTKYLENVTYRGHSYEYSLSFDFRLHSHSRDERRTLDRIATVVVDPDDTLRDRRRMNNTSTYTFNF